MRDADIDTDVIELPETPRSESQALTDSGDHERAAIANDELLPRYSATSKNHVFQHNNTHTEHKWPRWILFQDFKEVFYLLLVIVAAIPIILLATYAPRLTTKLGSQACLPNGEFKLPGTASIWDPAYFFTITITSQGSYDDWTYTHVKIIDVLWDVAMGRGGQLILIYIAYRVFSQSLTWVMETKPVSYRTYSAVSFECTSLYAIWNYLGSVHKTTGRRGSRVFIVMILASLYVVSMPTLFSAMTGYAALFTPSLEMPPKNFTGSWICQDLGGCSIYPCGGGGTGDPAEGDGLQAGWGVILDSMRFHYVQPMPITIDNSYYFAQYYDKYKTQYNALHTDPACHGVSNLTDCPATNIESDLTEGEGFVTHLTAPLLNIQLWGNQSDTNKPNVWLCNGLIINADDFNPGNVTGICNAAPNVFTGTSYQWGFSFLLLLFVCILNLIFAALMYGLWLDTHRHIMTTARREKKISANGTETWREVDYPTMMSSIMHMAAQARADHGDEVFEWSSKKLKKEVWRGKSGIRARKTLQKDQIEEGA